MRLKINLELNNITLDNIAKETATNVNKLLGVNNKWHDLPVKPFTCSLILGGEVKKRDVIFKEKGFLYINTEDKEVIDAISSNEGLDFSIENPKIFKGYNLLSVKKVIYNTNGKKNWVTEDNKNNFIKYVKDKYCVDIEILKIKNSSVMYKNGAKLPTSDLLIRCNTDKNVANLFESGIGASCSIGFGLVELINKKI